MSITERHFAVCQECEDDPGCWRCDGIGVYRVDAFDADFLMRTTVNDGNLHAELVWLREDADGR